MSRLLQVDDLAAVAEHDRFALADRVRPCGRVVVDVLVLPVHRHFAELHDHVGSGDQGAVGGALHPAVDHPYVAVQFRLPEEVDRRRAHGGPYGATWPGALGVEPRAPGQADASRSGAVELPCDGRQVRDEVLRRGPTWVTREAGAAAVVDVHRSGDRLSGASSGCEPPEAT